MGIKRTNIDLSPDLRQAIKHAASKRGIKSSSAYIRLLLVELPEIKQAAEEIGVEIEPFVDSWGGNRHTKKEGQNTPELGQE